MKVSLVSTILGHGTILQEVGTGISLLLSDMSQIETVILLTWKKNLSENLDWTDKIIINEIFSEKSTLSSFSLLLNTYKFDSDLILYNLMPTAYGQSSIVNLIGLMAPIFLQKILRKRVKVIYHNSVFTNDYVKLGYIGNLNLLKAKFLRLIEKYLFQNVETYFLSPFYVNLIRKKIEGTKVSTLNLPYFQVMGTLYLNNLLDKDKLIIKNGPLPRILLFGYWGPQKDPESALMVLRNVRKKDVLFNLTIAGAINSHFSNIKKYYESIFSEYEDTIDNRRGYVKESEILALFTNTDLVILNYVTPGGYSSVLAMCKFFKRYVIVPEHEVFKEQLKGYERAIYSDLDHLEENIMNFLQNFGNNNEKVVINIKDNILQMQSNLLAILG